MQIVVELSDDIEFYNTTVKIETLETVNNSVNKLVKKVITPVGCECDKCIFLAWIRFLN